MSESHLPVPDEPVPDERAGSGLTGDEDARLRTLAALGELGELSPELRQLRRSYRERDARAEVRPPAPVTWPALEVPEDPGGFGIMTGSREVDQAVLAGDRGSAQQLERGDDELPALGQDPDEWAAADALVEGQPTELGEPGGVTS